MRITKILVLNSLDRLSLDLEDTNLLLTIRVAELTRSTRKGITRDAPTDTSFDASCIADGVGATGIGTALQVLALATK